MDIRLFDILVYNRAPEEFNAYWDKKVAVYRCDESDEKWADRSSLYKSYIGRCARFSNSVIGYIHVFLSGGIDLITTLSIDVREKKYLEGAPDIWYDPSTFTRTRTNEMMSSNEILDRFNKDLLFGCNERLQGRYVDLEAWHNFSKYIDWHGLLYPEEHEKRDVRILNRCFKEEAEEIAQVPEAIF